MLIINCSHGKHFGGLMAKKLRKPCSDLIVTKFPDDEIYVRFDCGLQNRHVVLVQSFYKNISDCIIEVILASKTATELGAKKVILVAPYFPYLRQDKRFHKGEAVSQSIIAGLIDNYFDAVCIFDPHLHRKNSLSGIFRIKAIKLTSNRLIAEYIKNNIPKPVIIGPDEESYKWAKNVAEMLGAQSSILKKKRYSSYHVKIKVKKKVALKNRNAVIVDDIVSTGHTILETAKALKNSRAKKVYCLCVHGIFAGNALAKLKNAGIRVVSANTIPSKAARIDVSREACQALKTLLYSGKNRKV